MRQPTDPGEQKVVDDILQYGWHVVNVLGERDLPEFTYTIGLFRSYEHPEVLIYGLPRERAHQLVNDLGEKVRQGVTYVAGNTYDDILRDYRCTFRAIPSSQYAEHLGWAMWFYEGRGFPALQLVYPDAEGRWPWDGGTSESFRKHQLILADAPVPPKGAA